MQLEIGKIYDGKVKVLEGNVADLPFEDNTFDIVTAFETVYFWPDFVNDLKEVLRVLKDDGSIIVTEWELSKALWRKILFLW